MLSLAALLTGLFLIGTGFQEPVQLVWGAGFCAIAWLARPNPGASPRADVVAEAEFPHLYRLVNTVAERLGGEPIRKIVVTHDFNAYYGVYGWRREPVLTIGLPLWLTLRPRERLSLLGHEVAHGVNGDGTRGFVIGSAVRALQGWIEILRPQARYASSASESIGGYVGWVLSIPFALVERLLGQLLWLEKQQAEFFADYLESTVAGTDAAVSSLRRMGAGAHWHDFLLRNVYGQSQSGAHLLTQFQSYIASLPEREWQRLDRASRKQDARLDASHPPTWYRISFLLAHPISVPMMVVDDRVMAEIDAELASLHEKIGQRLIGFYVRN